MKKLTKSAKALIICGCVFLCLLTAVLIYYFGASHPEFASVSAQAFEIPGLETKFVPQGISYEPTNDKFVVCGYMGDGSAARIYVIDGETGETEKHITLQFTGEEGMQDYTGHAGGIAISYPYAFICGEGYVHRFNFTDLLAAEDAGKLTIIDSYKTGNGADFLTIVNDKLIVGEFYREKVYPTPEAHHISFGEETHRALSYAYQIDHSQPHGFNTEILYGISMPDQVQGMCLSKDGNIVLSTSYGLPNSIVYVYKNILGQPAQTQVQLAGGDVDVYFLTENDLIKVYNDVPCMSEEIVLVDDKIYILFESKCSKYRFVTRTRMSHVHSMDI